MSFTCLKCAKCMIPTGECCENCLSVEKRVNKGQHYVGLWLWREKRELTKKLTIKMVDDVIDALQEIVPEEFNDELNRQMFPRGREAAVKELEEKIEEAGCVNQENKS